MENKVFEFEFEDSFFALCGKGYFHSMSVCDQFTVVVISPRAGGHPVRLAGRQKSSC